MKRSIEDDLAEARGHLTYFQQQKAAYELAMKRMQEDIRTCAREIQKWNGRLEKLEAQK